MAESARRTAQRILTLQEEHRRLVERVQPRSRNGLRLLDHLFQYPVVSANSIARFLDVSYPTANNLLRLFAEQGILMEAPTKRSDRVFRYQSYLNLVDQGHGSSEYGELEGNFAKSPG